MLDSIFNRRSVRKYKDTRVEQEKLDTVLRAGMYAPSGHNKQSWHFIVVSDRQLIEEYQKNHPYSAMLSQAPLLIIVCGDLQAQCAPDYYLEDCSAATQNMLLAAYELGLGTCWMGIAPNRDRMDAINKIFGIPESATAFCGIAIGYADESRDAGERYKAEKIHINRW